MAGRLQVTLVIAYLMVALCTQSNAQQDGGDGATSTNPTLPPPPPTPDPLIHNLQFSLPIVIVSVILFIMAVIVIVVMRKARYGQFCCLKPKMSFRYIDDDEDEERGSTDEQEGSQKPPTYKMTDIAPPAYQDAVQDVLIHQQTDASAQEGEPQEENVEEEKEEIVEVPLDEHEPEDDRAPLNP